jgi:catechol 2,3-dioxygenase-like lactoylglutathione lyase family enzyme
MTQNIASLSILVPDYDEAITFYVEKMGFTLIEDTRLSPTKRWVVVMPRGATETGLLLAKADSAEQLATIGNQAGGRVFLILRTDDFERDYKKFAASGIEFLETPRQEPYGQVVVFRDAFGNKWDLIGPLAKEAPRVHHQDHGIWRADR